MSVVLPPELLEGVVRFAEKANCSYHDAVVRLLQRAIASHASSALGVKNDLHPSVEDSGVNDIEDEPDEVLWDFLEPASRYSTESLRYNDLDAEDEPDEVLLHFLDPAPSEEDL